MIYQMENLVLITAHCPTEEQEKMLEECIDSVINLNHHVLLISHTHVPIHIQKKCKYYFYDHFNDINQDEDLLYYTFHTINHDAKIRSKYFIKEFYGFAIYRMFCMAAQVARNFGYKNIHHIEYDCRLLDNTLIDQHNELLNTYDSVFYTDNGEESGFLLGAFKSFRVDKLPDFFVNYQKEKMREMMVSVPLKPLESFTKHIFSQAGKICFRNSTDLKKDGKFYQTETLLRKKYFTPYYDESEDYIFLFYKNVGTTENNLKIYVNANKIIHRVIHPTWWQMIPLCYGDDLTNLLIISDGKIIYDKSFNKEERELFKKNSFIDRS